MRISLGAAALPLCLACQTPTAGPAPTSSAPAASSSAPAPPPSGARSAAAPPRASAEPRPAGVSVETGTLAKLSYDKGAWVGERVNPGMTCRPGGSALKTGPVPFKYVIRPDLTGFVNMKFSRESPSCWGETAIRGQQLALTRAKAVWS